uniref:Uncharacterized protein n=1 Tax=Chromera velia CCMP2878 TaxID=1169474 RepID=A0A0G4FS98_9ALVE|eukprot:Cvel_3684.t1-p1 / transcript=Cvel_3684.t1 / gene=Cvel_3684 / organism=Chromera_velia_CCMP2878 / gene_product=hypothetical protein / transcript_product=hypothetical protein / location=Cvel_scaffold153:27893-28570(+) / protein_length=226 / sequence_SO=supercontig / SO=protein_coding / is_pseudo=false
MWEECSQYINLWEGGLGVKLKRARDEGIGRWGRSCLDKFFLPQNWNAEFLSFVPAAAMKGLKATGSSPEEDLGLLWALGAAAVHRIMHWGDDRVVYIQRTGKVMKERMVLDDGFQGGCALARHMVAAFGVPASEQLYNLLKEQPLKLANVVAARVENLAGSKSNCEGAWAALKTQVASLACMNRQSCLFASEILTCIPDHWSMVSSYKNFEDKKIKTLPECNTPRY